MLFRSGLRGEEEKAFGCFYCSWILNGNQV